MRSSGDLVNHSETLYSQYSKLDGHEPSSTRGRTLKIDDLRTSDKNTHLVSPDTQTEFRSELYSKIQSPDEIEENVLRSMEANTNIRVEEKYMASQTTTLDDRNFNATDIRIDKSA